MNNTRYAIGVLMFFAILVQGACAPAPSPTLAPSTSAPPVQLPTLTAAPSATATTPPTAVPPSTPPSATVALTAPGSVSIIVNLGPGRDGDQTPGTATLISQDAKTQVVVSIKPGAAGLQQPIHIHEGACPGVGAVKYPLTNVVDGKSTTVVDAPLKALLAGNYSINVHESTANSGKYVACGGIPKGVAITLDKGRDGDQTPGTAVLVSAGGKTDVYVSIKPAAAGIQQPVHIHEGSCPGVGAVKFPLTNIVDGKSKTTVDASLDDLVKGGYSINAHASTADAGKYVACGGIKVAGSASAPNPPATQEPPASGGYKYP